MADNRTSENLEVLERTTSFALGAENALSFGDENCPLSPGEVAVMRNQPTVAGRLLSPSRKSNSDSSTDSRKSKTKYFSSPKTGKVNKNIIIYTFCHKSFPEDLFSENVYILQIHTSYFQDISLIPSSIVHLLRSSSRELDTDIHIYFSKRCFCL